MILELPRQTEAEYTEFKKQFYEKPDIPEIELELEEFQRRLLIDGDLSILSDFREKLAIYSKSLLLKFLKGTSDFIEPEEVEELANRAAFVFIKRYFRGNPIIGASFAGILKFKVKEVLSSYFKKNALDTNLSFDMETDEENSISDLLSYSVYLKNQNKEDSDLSFEILESKIKNKTAQLVELGLSHNIKNLDTLFLKYLLFITLYKKYNEDDKIEEASKRCISLLVKNDIEKTTSILESAFLDLRF